MKGPGRCFHILIVDDDDVIRESLVTYLTHYHEPAPGEDYELIIHAAANAADARKKLSEQHFNLVLSDIRMPLEDGFSLLKDIQKNYPETRTALITAYKVDDYIRMAKKTGVCNIIAKTAPFNFDELSNVVNNLLTPESAFGLEHYMGEDCRLNEFVITGSAQIMQAFYMLREFFTLQGVRDVDNLSTAMIEAITNAVYHVAKLPDGTLKYMKGQDIPKLDEDEYVFIYSGRSSDRIGISIVDQGGRITADEVLYWLDRNISGSGLLDTHGRGVYLIHTLVDRLIINIAPGKRTEIIVLDYFNNEYSHNKPLYINQI